MRRWLRTCLAPLLLLAAAAPSTAGLVFLEVLPGLGSARAVTLAPDGAQVYVGAAEDDTVAVFRRDAGTGRLTFVDGQRDGVGGVDGIDGARSVALSPDGAHAYVAGFNDDALAVFARDPRSGRLVLVQVVRDGSGGITGLDGPESVAVSPDGAHLYATGGNGDALVVFARDPASGTLSFVQVLKDGSGGVDGLNRPRGAALSPDGAHLYVAGEADDAVAVFARDAATGALAFVEALRDGAAGVDGLARAFSVALAPDGAHVYVASSGDDAVALFRRDAATGRLTFVEVRRDGVDGVDGLNGAAAVVVAPDGEHVYVAGGDDDAVAVFARNAATGALTLTQVVRNTVRGIQGLNGPRALALDPGGAHLYVAGASDDALLVFGARCGDGVLDPGEQCDDGRVSGDGCSEVCRRTCASRRDCDDGDRCTEDRCRDGECTNPRCGFAGAQCELADVVPALDVVPDCVAMPRGLRRMLVGAVRRTRVQMRSAAARHADGRKVYKRARKLLAPLRPTATRLARRHRLSEECRTAVDYTLEALKDELKAMLRREGVCAP
jgi:cysteine-rich repeat protein